jgi:hypothetical protein
MSPLVSDECWVIQSWESVTNRRLLVLFPRHLTPQRRYENISHIQTFRDYFHYHIKASKVRQACLMKCISLRSID